MNYSTKKNLLWLGGIPLFFVILLFSLGYFSEKGVLIIAKEKVLATASNLPLFENQKNIESKALPEAKDIEGMSKNLLVGLVALEKSGASSPESRDNLVNKLYKEADLDKPFLFTPYSLADLDIVSNGQKAEEIYQKENSAIFKKNYYQGLGDEVEVWIKSQGLGGLEKEKGNTALEKGNKSYQKITDSLKAMAVPEKIAEVHLKILNTFKALTETTSAMAKNDDILSSLPAIQFFYEKLLENK